MAEPVTGSVAEPVEAIDSSSLRQAQGPKRTGSIWYYQLDPGRNMGKTNPLNDKDLAEFVELQKTKPETEQSWNVRVATSSVTEALEVQEDGAKANAETLQTLREPQGNPQGPTNTNGYDLSVKNPNTPEEAPLRKPQEILAEMEQLDEDTRELLDSIKELI